MNSLPHHRSGSRYCPIPGVLPALVATLAATAAMAPAPASANIAMAWGSNRSGQLGNANPQAESTVPVAVSGLSGVTAVSAGGEHSLALLENQSLVAWGYNARGQLGSGSFANSNVPVPVSELSEVTAISGGGEHSLAKGKRVDVHVVAFGSDESGQLGNNSTTNSDLPVNVNNPLVPAKETVAISAGGEHSLALMSRSSVMAWGDNEFGELGDGTAVEQSSLPVAAWGGAGGVKAIAAGGQHSLALATNGAVLAWGRNSVGQLGNGSATGTNWPVWVSGLSGVTAIAAGDEHSLALVENGTVMAWGDNAQGQLGNGSFTNSDVPVPVSGLSGVVAIAAGGEHSLALLSNGTVMAWGGNQDGQLGDGSDEDRNLPVAVSGLSGVSAIAAGESHSLAFGAPPPPPTVAAIGPQEGSPNGGTRVIIAGSNLNLATGVYFGYAPASFTVDSPEFITAVAPPGAGTVDVRVETPGGWSATSPSDQFSCLPKVTELKPSEGLPSGGTEVAITGKNLALASAVKFGESNAIKFTVNSDTSITALSPPGTEAVDVTVKTPGGTSTTSPADRFGYTVPGLTAPSVSGISPAEGPSVGGTSVTINGKNFAGAYTVKFGSTSATSFTVNPGGTSITAASPPAVGTVDVTVTTPGGTSATSSADQFSYRTTPPTVTNVSPNKGYADRPTPVLITGTNFFRPTEVGFGAEYPGVSFTPVSETMIIAMPPRRPFWPCSGLTCIPNETVDVTVTTPSGKSATSAADQYTFLEVH